MKASELMKMLQDEIAANGDAEMYVSMDWNCDGHGRYISVYRDQYKNQIVVSCDWPEEAPPELTPLEKRIAELEAQQKERVEAALAEYRRERGMLPESK